ncbi:MAG: aldehyde dehydrogenase family protein [Burkholderiales bacterium]|nr:aldehyde dehydrogenase family protein [Burkholderiales bacterium]
MTAKFITPQELLNALGIHNNHPGTAIGACWLNGAKTITSICPTNEATLGTVQQTSVEQLHETLDASHEAFLVWRNVPAPKRGELVRLIGDRLRKYKSTLGSLISIEMGKSKQEGDGEVQEMIDMADFAVGQSRMLYGNTMHSERENHRMYEQWHPLGVVGVISAFNFPVAVWAWNAFIATICGNSVVWKPSPKTPLCSIAVQKICAEVLTENNYPAIFSLITTDDMELSKKFVDDIRIPLISFTGSTKVGREVGQQLANRFAKSLLELGGNNAVIIDKSADMKTAIPSLVFAAVGTAGQRCTTLRRLIIHESIYRQVVDSLVNAYKQLKIGDPMIETNHVGPLIDKPAVEAYTKAINAIKSKNGKIAIGGNTINGFGYFVEPTIVEADPNWDIVNEETFAPILYVMPFKNLEQAIAINNQVAYGLSSAIYTQEMKAMEEFLSCRGSDCGIANINIGTSGAEIGGAFGGEKATGGGREAGSDSWKYYMRRQTATINYGNTLTLAQGIKFNF